MAKFKSFDELRANNIISVTATDNENEFSDLAVKMGEDIVGVIRRDDSPQAVQVVFQAVLDKMLKVMQSNLEERLQVIENEFVKNIVPEVEKRERQIAQNAYNQGRRSKRFLGIF